MREHPVFRWFGPEMNATKAPFVVVGRDDPGIFATELVQEYAFLASAAALRAHRHAGDMSIPRAGR